MKWRGPGASLNPSAEAARAAARAAMRSPARPQTGGPPAEGVRIGQWWLTTDENGALVADHIPSGARRSVALPPEPDDERKGQDDG